MSDERDELREKAQKNAIALAMGWTPGFEPKVEDRIKVAISSLWSDGWRPPSDAPRQMTPEELVKEATAFSVMDTGPTIGEVRAADRAAARREALEEAARWLREQATEPGTGGPGENPDEWDVAWSAALKAAAGELLIALLDQPAPAPEPLRGICNKCGWSGIGQLSKHGGIEHPNCGYVAMIVPTTAPDYRALCAKLVGAADAILWVYVGALKNLHAFDGAKPDEAQRQIDELPVIKEMRDALKAAEVAGVKPREER